ncbi:MAG: transposase [Acidobacteria bacterium]|nr:transposase [Acidobacteriota bacterium]
MFTKRGTHAMTDNPREIKGLEIADRYRITNQNGLWLVPSQSGKGKYKVRPDIGYCSCPDYEYTQSKCKHQYAVEVTIERERTTTTTTTPDGQTTTTTTETVKVTRKTYPQVWPAYNAAQTQEKAQFQYLLHKLCEGVGEPAQVIGRPRLPLEDMIFSMAFKVYSTVSGRRFMSDLRDAHGKGYVATPPSYNTIFRYFESEVLTPYLKMLVEESSLPMQAIEEDFAVDSSGLSTGARQKWHDAKWGTTRLDFGGAQRRNDRRDWLKIHIMCGVKTNVITAVEVTDASAGDSPQFKTLVDATAENFAMCQVSADKAYLSSYNMKAVKDHYATPYIPFKANSRITGRKNQSPLWKQMFHFYSYNQERFMQNYHKRSNVETTFHMIKSKFGDALRSRDKTAQINEALCKVLCHNIVVLIQSMYELGLKPKFWSECAA